jgi:hypothetical protein
VHQHDKKQEKDWHREERGSKKEESDLKTPGAGSRKQARRERDLKRPTREESCSHLHLTERIYKVVLQMSILEQICQLIVYHHFMNDKLTDLCGD